VEAILAKPQYDASDAKAAADAAVTGASPLEHNGYKVRLVHGLVMQTVAELK
jgi:CO/xanthine dehydrogenase FAD-binding subunit